MKCKATKFNAKYTETELDGLLSGLAPNLAYAFTKKEHLEKYNQIINLLPVNYVASKQAELESVDFVFSGSTESSYLLTIAAGRNNQFRGSEWFDIDVFNIAPESGSADTYFLNQWHHFRDNEGNRISYPISSFLIADEPSLKAALYSTFLTGSTSYYSFANYENEKPDFYEIHTKSFGDLNARKGDKK